MAVASPSDIPIYVEPMTVQAIYGLCVLTSVILAAVIWRHRDKTGARYLLIAVVGGLWWTACHFLATLTADVELSMFLERVYLVGVVVMVAAIFLFVLEYTGREHLVTRKTIALLSIEPVIVVVLALFNPGNVFFESIEPTALRAVGVNAEFGVAFGLHTLYSYALTLVLTLLVLDLIYRTKAMYRGQLAVLVGAVVLPLPPNIVAILQLTNFDATPLGFVISNLLFTVAITRYRLIDLAPIARDRVVNNVNDAVFVVDVESRLVDMNPAAEDLAEEYVGEADLIGEDVREILELVPDLAEVYDDIVADERARTIEYELGGGHWQTDATPIADSRDQTVGWLFLIRDITEQKRREQQLRERNEQLDKFASVVSHDLRNPLQVASGRVEIARETGDVEHLDDAEDALDRMETIIEDVLALARSGEEVTELTLVALRDAAESAWDNVETDGVALSVETGARVTADRNRLVRLLENLFRNAVEHGVPPAAADGSETVAQPGSPGRMRVREYGDDGHVGEDQSPLAGTAEPTQLTVAMDVIRRDGRAVGFRVSDDGTGIPEDERDSVFESGYSTDAEGTGFGLTIVSQIAEAHGWHVRAAESEDGGARFEFTGVEVVND